MKNTVQISKCTYKTHGAPDGSLYKFDLTYFNSFFAEKILISKPIRMLLQEF